MSATHGAGVPGVAVTGHSKCQVGQWVRTPGSPGYVEIVGPEMVAVRNGHGMLHAWRHDEVEEVDRG